jgi:hypothetical protein
MQLAGGEDPALASILEVGALGPELAVAAAWRKRKAIKRVERMRRGALHAVARAAVAAAVAGERVLPCHAGLEQLAA